MFQIRLPRPPSVNGLFANQRNGRGGRFPTQAYKDWQESVWEIINHTMVLGVKGPINIVYRVGKEPDKRKRDLFNYEKALSDMLVKIGAMEDDSLIQHGIMMWTKDVPAGFVDIAIQEVSPDGFESIYGLCRNDVG